MGRDFIWGWMFGLGMLQGLMNIRCHESLLIPYWWWIVNSIWYNRHEHISCKSLWDSAIDILIHSSQFVYPSNIYLLLPNSLFLTRQVYSLIPTILIIQIKALPVKGIFKNILQKVVIGSLLKFQSPAVVKKLTELVDHALTDLLYWNWELLLHYFLVFLFLVVSAQVLPRYWTLVQVDQDVGDALDVVSSPLLNT